MVTIMFRKAESQVSERTGKAYTKNVRYEEEETSYFGSVFPPKELVMAACDGLLPDFISYTIQPAND